MALSPSPTSPLTGRRSLTPPAQPLTKRDKRRNQHVALQQDLQSEFENGRESHYRQQLIALQQDMNMVTNADPYKPEPLEDAPEDIARLVADQASGTPYQSEMSSQAGKWYTEFVHEVNEAKHQKELALIELSVSPEIVAKIAIKSTAHIGAATTQCETRATQIRVRLPASSGCQRSRTYEEHLAG